MALVAGKVFPNRILSAVTERLSSILKIAVPGSVYLLAEHFETVLV